MLTELYKPAMTDNSALLCSGSGSCSWLLRTAGKRSLHNVKQTGIPTPLTTTAKTDLSYNYKLVFQDCSALARQLSVFAEACVLETCYFLKSASVCLRSRFADIACCFLKLHSTYLRDPLESV